MPIDYSKWKDIEVKQISLLFAVSFKTNLWTHETFNVKVSDDEDDTHPNIDTPSLFRWRHQARVERMQQADQEKKQLEDEKAKYVVKYKK